MNVAQTHILDIVGKHFDGDGELSKVFAQIADIESVAAAAAAYDAATERVKDLSDAGHRLNDRAKILATQLRGADDRLRDSLIESRPKRSAISLDPGKGAGNILREIWLAREELRIVNLAIEHLVENLSHEAYISSLRTECDLCEMRAEALESIANARAAEIAEKLSTLTGSEGAITIDTRTSFTGRLVAEAAALKQQAARAKDQIHRAKERWEKIRKAAESRGK